MKLFDLFRRPPPRDEPSSRRFPLDLTSPFDVDQTAELSRLFDVPRHVRETAWVKSFWDTVWTAAFRLNEPNVFAGPDGFKYLGLSLLEQGQSGPVTANSVANVAASMVAQGVGIAVYRPATAHPAEPEFVIPMGVLDSILSFDCPEGEPLEVAEAKEQPDFTAMETSQVAGFERSTVKTGQKVLVGCPSSEYLSRAAARALHQHLVESWGLKQPRVSLMIVPPMRPSRSLVIGKSAKEFALEGVAQELVHERLRMLSWYLPPSRRLMLMPDDWSTENMTPLDSLI